jgi:c-di-GMP-binding flagellar brake protein YcgR
MADLPESVVELFDELLMMEMLRGQRNLEPDEARRWVELQRMLTRELCDSQAGQPKIDERRQYLRVATPLAVRVVSPGANFEATVLDLGAGGMGLRADVLPFPGEHLTLEWARTPMGEQFDLDLPARVMWMRKATHELGPGFGISFRTESRLHDQRVSTLLLTLLRQERAARTILF